MALGEYDDLEVRFNGLYAGVVVDRVDPLGIGRVRLRIPGLIEPASAWALPRGGVGGGTNRRGFFDVPEVGADVFVQFLMGDVDRPVYESGNWGLPDDVTEIPERARDASNEDKPNIRVYETKEWAVVYDDRASNEMLIKNKNSGAAFKITPSEILIGTENSNEFLALGTTLAAWQKRIMDLLIAHNHPTGVGPSGPPLNAASFTTEKTRVDEHVSEFVKTQKAVP